MAEAQVAVMRMSHGTSGLATYRGCWWTMGKVTVAYNVEGDLYPLRFANPEWIDRIRPCFNQARDGVGVATVFYGGTANAE